MKRETKAVYFGRNEVAVEAGINIPVYRASTILSPDLKSYLARFDNDRRFESVTYGATGTQNSRALAKAVAAIEDGSHTIVTASGLSACTLSIAALVQQGDHILVTDSVYGPTRRFCNNVLSRYGVRTEFYDPSVGDNIARLIRRNTKLIYTESPGSLTFEMQDIDAITKAAHERDVLVAMDNTWGTPLFFQPLAHGVDISIQAGTKYIAGHSDLIIGLITTDTNELYKRIADYVMTIGDVAGPDDCFLALRGLRTMPVRLRQQFNSALQVASWLAQCPEVKHVHYPALETDPGHGLWRANFTGAASLFGLTLHTTDLDAVARFVDGLELFNIGSSWGGYESLVAVNTLPLERDVVPWTHSPILVRLHIGLEDPEDLIADLRAGLQRL